MEDFKKTKKLLKDSIVELYKNQTAYYIRSGSLKLLGDWLTKDHNDQLHTMLESAMEAIPKNASIEASQGVPYLEQLILEREIHATFLERMNWYFEDMEATILDIGLSMWRERYIDFSKIRSTFVKLVLDGKEINSNLMRNLRNMLMKSKVRENFEKPSFEDLVVSYRDKAKQFIERCDCGDYLKEAEKCIEEEIERESHYLDVTGIKEIMNMVAKEMIESHMDRFIHMENSGLVHMIKNDKFDDLHRMYNLMRRLPCGLELIAQVMTEHIRAIGGRLVTKSEKLKTPVCIVQRLLDEKDKYDNIISVAFNNDIHFQKDLTDSFIYIVNLTNRSPEFISLFVDKIVQKGVIEENEDSVLSKVMVLYSFLQNKDVFEKYYRHHMAKRLLEGKTCDDTERCLIQKLQKECGHSFTSKLECMINDVTTSQATLQAFHADVGAEITDCPSLTVQILNRECWPMQSVATSILPPEIVGVSDRFMTYYLNTHQDRKLFWQMNMGTADLIATFGNGQQHELNVSTYQMCILVLFNNADKLSYKEIEKATEIPASDLRRCLQSLTCVKGKNVLSKEPMSKDITEDDIFYFNANFTSKLKKIQLGCMGLLAKPDEPERQRVPDKRCEIEAAIVRNMKLYRELSHTNLVQKVAKALGEENPELIKDIKKGIDKMIDREYIKRHQGRYHYIP